MSDDGFAVESPGLHTTVQDLGRVGYQALGVPISGPLDSLALRLGNALVGNPQGAAALEILGGGPTLRVLAENVRVTIAGFGTTLAVDEGARIVPAWRSIVVPRSQSLRVLVGREAICAYLAVEGAIAVPEVLGSAATYVRAGLGGFYGRALQSGDIVGLARGRASERVERRLPCPPSSLSEEPIRVVLGPQHDHFTDEALATLFGTEFRVSKDADRMGMRLDGPPLLHRRGWDIVSDAIAAGAIQVPGSGRPIILLADHQTTGGYPKIATVISADLPAVGRRRPGDAIRFTAVTVEEAEHLARTAAAQREAMIASIEPIHEDSTRIDLASLYNRNLISGVVTAVE
jgi:biotin-dependent carboxylase-like uncharacterized protein